MVFYGQERIRLEMSMMLPDILNGRNANLLFRAPSGCGKTTLGLLFLHQVGVKESRYYIARTDGLDVPFDPSKRFHMLDEIHLLRDPEFLYPIMDAGRYTFLLMSNESGALKEPLRNRCFQFIFEPYSNDEMRRIVAESIAHPLSADMIDEIVSRCRNTPRIAHMICERLGYVFRNHFVPANSDELIPILDNVLHIRKRGLTTQDEIYLDFLRQARRASLNTIIHATRIDRDTIITEIEPYLIYLREISITSRGREIAKGD